eukprot:4681083-Prymnesium_polylepis.1
MPPEPPSHEHAHGHAPPLLRKPRAPYAPIGAGPAVTGPPQSSSPVARRAVEGCVALKQQRARSAAASAGRRAPGYGGGAAVGVGPAPLGSPRWSWRG